MAYNAKCKICNLPDEIKWRIERDMVDGKIGATNLCKKYPETSINESNIYTHRKHLASAQARDAYEKSLHERADSDSSTTTPPESACVSQGLLELTEITPPLPTTPQKQSLLRQAMERATTGNRILDDVAVLDMVIATAEEKLADVTIKDILEAIKLKHQLLDGNVGEGEAERDSKTVLKIGTILNVVARMEKGEDIDIIDMDKLDDVLK